MGCREGLGGFGGEEMGGNGIIQGIDESKSQQVN